MCMHVGQGAGLGASRRHAADSHRHPVVAPPRGPISDAALVTSPIPSLLLRARIASDAVLRRLPAGPAAPIDPIELYARMRDAERYRDRLPVGSAEREGAEEMLRQLRSAYASMALGQDVTPAAAHANEGRAAA